VNGVVAIPVIVKVLWGSGPSRVRPRFAGRAGSMRCNKEDRMRKLLTASTILLGASLSVANAAQIYTSSPTGQVPGTNMYGAPTTAAATAATTAGGVSDSPPPGQIAVHIDLQENVYLVANWDSAASINGNKQQPYSIIGYPRLHMSFNGTATNGLQYGLYWQIRNTGPTGYPSSTGSVGASGNDAGSATQSGEYMFWRYDYVYLGMPQFGTVRIGQSDGPYSLFMVGTFDDVATGLFNGDIVGAATASTEPGWAFDYVGDEYTTAKLIYLSPKFFGVDFGLSFEPSTANLTDGNQCNTLSPADNPLGFGPINCGTQSTSNSPNDLERRRNTIEAAIRYQGAFGPVGVVGSFITMQGSPVNAGPFVTESSTFTPGSPTSFKHLSLYDAGAAVTAFNVTVGGNVIWGQYNFNTTPLVSGGTDSVAWVAGAEYVYGPMQVGGQLFRWKYQGEPGLGPRVDQGIGFGLTYNIAPGLALLAEYLYGKRYQGGFDFSTGSVGPGSNNVQQQTAGVGFQFRW
jgi:predicted porin